MRSVIRFFTLLAVSLFTCNISWTQPPRLNSFPSSPATVYLDFDGQFITGTSWNWSGSIYAQPSGLSNADIIEIFNRVAEDYRPFNLNITTDSMVYFAAPFNRRIRVIITPTYEWYGKAGGISYVGSFNWGTETPAFVFSGLLSYDVKYVAEACSHETGHTLGLQHQSIYDANCNKVSEYNDGQGDGEIGWAPIMGSGYYKNLTTWNIGPNTEGCNSIQNDLSIISGSLNEIGFRPDDHGNDASSATRIVFNGPSFSVNGLINNSDDTDVFKFQMASPTNLKLSAIPQNVGWGNAGADIDIKLTLLNAQSEIIGVYNPALLLNVGLDTNLNAGMYYIMVNGTGNMNHSSYGSLGFYNLAGNLGIALPLHKFILKASTDNGNHFLNWTYTTDEKILNIAVEASFDGKNFHQLVSLSPEAKFFSYKPFNNYSFYRLKAVTVADESCYYSSISKILVTADLTPVQLVSNTCQQKIYCVARSFHSYQLFDTGGRLLAKGILVNGMNNIDIGNAPKGILFLHITDGTDGWTERLIKQ
jgi:hypothetical protein